MLHANASRVSILGQQLSIVESHRQYINTDSLSLNVPEVEKRVAELHSVQLEQAEQVSQWDRDLEVLLDQYQFGVRQTSVHLLRCDKLIAAMEKRKKELSNQ